MTVLQTTATGVSTQVNARRVRGWVRGGAVGIAVLWLFNTLGGDDSGPLLDLARLTGHRRRGDEDPLSAASLRRLLGNLRERDIYLCGPPGMTASVRRALHELGVADADIHEEMFTF